MTLRRFVLAAAAVVCAAGASVAQEAQQLDPDWPCVQRKVPSLTPAAIWTGPAIGNAKDWKADPEVSELVSRLSQRRIPLDAAEAEIAAFAEELPPEEREVRLTSLFAGLFEIMNAERGEILEGIERYARRQKELAERIREETAELAGTAPGTQPEAERALHWNHRVFEERRRSLPYICEVPRLVEQRLFALGRAIGNAMPD